MKPQDLYLRTYDPTGKSADIVSHHRVWDAKLFLATLRERYGKLADTPDFREVSQVTERDYRIANNYKVF